ncbi:MAG: glycolate oxidase subunit GlcF [Gammaproteobacteria bacterium]|nr:glycolate oxidase subunit GlcF [Gammaproteobacteria bacterium]
MKTQLTSKFINMQHGSEVEAILRSCVHCGFCNATCPTYQELQDEREGPRGRIYLIKQMLEGAEITSRTRTHLDRCLTCRNCETTCPSGVKYGRLIDFARNAIEQQVPRNHWEQLQRYLLRKVLPTRWFFDGLLKLGQIVRPLLPAKYKAEIPLSRPNSPWPEQSHNRIMLVLQSCGQTSATPNTNAAAARVLDKLGISLVVAAKAGCCGAVSYHLGANEEGLDLMRHNIDTWWPAIDNSANNNKAEAIVITASGCGALVKEYGDLLAHDPEYAEKAKCVSDLTKDLSEVILAEDLSSLSINKESINKKSINKIALHIPCSLQHGMGLPDTVRKIFNDIGFNLSRTREDHLCCGSAGTYSILQSQMSKKLLSRKIDALTVDQPDIIATANIGCQLHIQSQSKQQVNHWIELLDKACQQ